MIQVPDISQDNATDVEVLSIAQDAIATNGRSFPLPAISLALLVCGFVAATLLIGCKNETKTDSEIQPASTTDQVTPQRVSHAGTWMRVSDNFGHILIQNNTHWVDLEIVIRPIPFPPTPVGFPMLSVGGSYTFNGDDMIRSQHWSPHWPDDAEKPTRVGYTNTGDSVEIHEFDDKGIAVDSELFSKGDSSNLDSPLFGTWKLGDEEIYLVANGTDVVRLEGSTLTKLSTVQANKYELQGNHVIFERYGDFKPQRIKTKIRYQFERSGDSLILRRASDNGDLGRAAHWTLQMATPLNTASDLTTETELDSAEEYFHRAEEHRSQRRLLKAHEDYSKAIQLSPDIGRYHHQRGDNHMARKLFRDAIADYTTSMQLEPDFPSNHFDRGVAHSRLGEWETALVDFKRYQELAPDRYDAYTNISAAYLGLRDADSAIANLSKAIEIDGADPSAYFLRATAYFLLKDAEHTIEDCTKAIELAPNFSKAYEMRGAVYNIIGEKEKAQSDLARAKELEENQ